MTVLSLWRPGCQGKYRFRAWKSFVCNISQGAKLKWQLVIDKKIRWLEWWYLYSTRQMKHRGPDPQSPSSTQWAVGEWVLIFLLILCYSSASPASRVQYAFLLLRLPVLPGLFPTFYTLLNLPYFGVRAKMSLLQLYQVFQIISHCRLYFLFRGQVIYILCLCIYT